MGVHLQMGGWPSACTFDYAFLPFLACSLDGRYISTSFFSDGSSKGSSATDVSTLRFFTNGFRLKGCCSENYGNVLWNNNKNNFKNDRAIGNGVQKARVYAACIPQLLHVSEEAVKVEDQQKSLNSRAVNGGGAVNRGNFTGVLDQPFQEKIMVAVDVDEADIRVHEFFKTHYFKKGIYSILGPDRMLLKSTQLSGLKNTIQGSQEIHFGNHFALDGQSRPKSDICKSLGAKVLIDDNPRYAIECVDVGMKVLLFDYENSIIHILGASDKSECIPRHPLVAKVCNINYPHGLFPKHWLKAKKNY